MLGWMARDAEAKSLGPLSSETLTPEGRGASLCQPISPKTAENATCPNTFPPQEFRAKKIACVTLCHLRFCSAGAVGFAPAVSINGVRPAGIQSRAHSPTLRGGATVFRDGGATEANARSTKVSNQSPGRA